MPKKTHHIYATLAPALYAGALFAASWHADLFGLDSKQQYYEHIPLKNFSSLDYKPEFTAKKNYLRFVLTKDGAFSYATHETKALRITPPYALSKIVIHLDGEVIPFTVKSFGTCWRRTCQLCTKS